MGVRNSLKKLWESRTLWFAILVPVLCSPLPILHPNSVARCGYCVLVIGIYWVTEIIPLAATSLLPVFLFPVFGIMPASDVCASYVKDTLMLFLGSLIVAVAVEKWNLHKRLALKTLTLVGPQPKWLLFGIMLPTWFLSMWMSNTATTAMMMPIVSAIIVEIQQCQDQAHDEENALAGNVDDIDQDFTEKPPRASEKMHLAESLASEGQPEDPRQRQMLGIAKTFCLATAYSANIGGMATLTGTPPNIIFKGLADDVYKDAKVKIDNPVNFGNWLLVGLPLSVLMFTFSWLWLQLYSEGISCLKFWKKDRTNYERVRVALRREYNKLGPMSFAEMMVTVNFVLLALLWVTRKPGFVPGWGDLFKDKYAKDSTPAIMVAVLLFILPARPLSWMACCRNKRTAVEAALSSHTSYEPILDWPTVNKRLAWGVLLLMGGGFAMADGCVVSGLSAWLSESLVGLSVLPSWTIAMLLALLIASGTEVTSNAATTSLFVPIVGDLALQLGVHPLYFMIPCTIAASLAFLLPVATPPNAIVFAAGYLKVKDMMLAGIPMNLMALLFLNLGINSWMVPIYDLANFPEEFRAQVNASSPASTVALTLAQTTASVFSPIGGSALYNITL